MNAEDLSLLRSLATRTQHLAQVLQHLLEWHGEVDVTVELQELQQLELETGELITRVQTREVVSWGRRSQMPRHPAPRHYTTSLPLSTEINHGIHVRRFGVDGRPSADSRTPPPLSGRWNEDES